MIFEATSPRQPGSERSSTNFLASPIARLVSSEIFLLVMNTLRAERFNREPVQSSQDLALLYLANSSLTAFEVVSL